MINIEVKARKYIKATFVVLIYFVLACNFIHSKDTKENTLNMVSLVVQYPYVNGQNGQLTYLRDTITKYHYSDLILYQLVKSRNIETNEKIPGSEQYFIYESSKPNGYLFKSLKDDTNGIKLSVDSLLAARAFAGTNFSLPPDSGWGSFSAQKSADQQEKLTEVYFSKKDYGPTAFDSIYYFYNKRLNKLDYTLSRSLDSSRGMKLFRVRLLFNAKESKQYKMVVPKREFLFEIFEPRIVNENEIIDFFKRFRELHPGYFGNQIN